MLSAADSDLVRRDPDVPGLATVLSPEEFAACLRRTLGRVDIDVSPALYIKYQPGKNCLAGFQLKIDTYVVPVHATAYRLDALHKLERARLNPGYPSVVGPGRAPVDDRALVVSFFPNDRKVPCLPLLTDPDRRNFFFGKVFPGRADLGGATVHPIAYKPQLRYVACVVGDGGGRALLKGYRERDYRLAGDNARTFESRDELRFPRLLGSADSAAALTFEWLPGELLSDLLASTSAIESVLRRVGRVLGMLHTQEPAGLPVVSPTQEAAAMTGVAATIGILCPQWAKRARTLEGDVSAALRELRPIIRPTHGDFYARQVLVSAEHISILDLDSAAWADPAADVGNFIAFLEREAIRGTFSRDRIDAGSEALIDGYGESAPPLGPRRIRVHAAAALFRMAVKPFRNREPDWPEKTDALLARVQELLRHGTRATPGEKRRPRAKKRSAARTGEKK
jgi:tRNA A-37 threonylcarbamoyl transferase component Bud32